MGAGYPATGLVAPKIGVAAYNGTGSQAGAFDWFHVSGDPVIEPDTCEATAPDPGYRSMFDGTAESLEDWNMAGPGVFTREADCSLKTNGGMGLLWHSEPLEGDYSLQLDWKLTKDDNGGVFIGFPDPGDDPWVAVDNGYEVQIDATDADDRTTGAIYTFQGADLAARDAALNGLGEWNHYEIRVEGRRIRIYLNDVLVNDFTSPAEHTNRVTWPSYIGLQNHGGGENVFYRDVQVKELADPENVPAEVTVTAPDQVETGEKATVEVEVASAAEETPTGEVVLSVDGTDLPAVDLEDGTATFEVGPFGSARTVELVARYAGDVATDPGTGRAQLEVAKAGSAASTVTVDAPEQLRVGKKAEVVVSVTSDADQVPTGRVVLSVDGAELPAVQLEDGKATVRIGPLGKPRTVELVASYSGDEAVDPGRATATVKVVAPASRP